MSNPRNRPRIPRRGTSPGAADNMLRAALKQARTRACLSAALSMLSEAERDASEKSGKGTRPYHKTVVVVNELSARVTQGVPINNTLSQEMHKRKAERHTLSASHAHWTPATCFATRPVDAAQLAQWHCSESPKHIAVAPPGNPDEEGRLTGSRSRDTSHLLTVLQQRSGLARRAYQFTSRRTCSSSARCSPSWYYSSGQGLWSRLPASTPQPTRRRSASSGAALRAHAAFPVRIRAAQRSLPHAVKHLVRHGHRRVHSSTVRRPVLRGAEQVTLEAQDLRIASAGGVSRTQQMVAPRRRA